ncbi:SRPBCC family protein [Arthrobacter sp. KK5.5]|uniref:SRPBCC family protein n=1 Tax=Arthrobacter sp. KK5.5 TaxID=3373084 RepID=UPI003EE6EAB0
MVDVTTEITIDRPVHEVAAYAADPRTATLWYGNIVSSHQLTPGLLAVGTEIAFTAVFLGRELRYTYTVSEYDAGSLLVMRTSEGPFPMRTTYRWEDAGEGRTRMTLRNDGEPSGFSRAMAPLMARQMKAANRKDLAALKRVLEEGLAGT